MQLASTDPKSNVISLVPAAMPAQADRKNISNACYLASSPLMKKVMDAVFPTFEKGMVPLDLMASLNDADKIITAIGGQAIFTLIADLVRNARDEVLLQTFTWDSKIPAVEYLKTAIEEAIQRKKLEKAQNPLCKPLRIYILIDDRGSFANFMFTGNLIKNKWPSTVASLGLCEASGLVEVYPATFHHNSFSGNHAKTVVVDSEKMVITGANYQASNFGHIPAHDAAVLIQGPAARAARADFINIWNTSKRQEENPSPPLVQQSVSLDHGHTGRLVPVLFTSREPQNTPSLFPLDNPVFCSYIAALENAQRMVQIATPNLNDPYIIDALADFINKKEGTTVELLLGKGFNDSRETKIGMGGSNQAMVDILFWKIDPAKHHRLKVRWFSLNGRDPVIGNVAGACHLKFMTADMILTILGNANLDKVSLRNLHEDNIVMDDPELTLKMSREMFTPAFERGIAALPSSSIKQAIAEQIGLNGARGRLGPSHMLQILGVIDRGNGFRSILLEKPRNWNFLPGQYVEITSGNRMSEMIKEASVLAISSGINDPYIEITARPSRMPWHQNHALRLSKDEWLQVTGPIGTSFPLDQIPRESRVLLLGGGSGLTALRSVMRSLPNSQNVSLFYSAKTESEIMYSEEVKEWAKQHVISMTQEKGKGLYSTGRITEILKDKEMPRDAFVFLCGPVEMIQALIRLLDAKGVPRTQIFASLPRGALEGGPVYRGDHPRLK